MHGTLPQFSIDAPALQQATRTFFCIRMKAHAPNADARYSPWWQVTPREYAAFLAREGFPVSRPPVADFVSGPLQGRAIYGEHQIAEWDHDLRALYRAHRAEQPCAPA